MENLLNLQKLVLDFLCSCLIDFLSSKLWRLPYFTDGGLMLIFEQFHIFTT